MMGVLDVPTTQYMHLWGDENKERYESMPREEVHERLARTIAEVAMAVSPEVTVIDARTVLCKSHTSYSDGDPRTANRLIISGDQLAADIVAADVLKEVCEEYDIGPTKGTFEYAARLGFGVGDRDGIRIKEVEA
jgi:hypothetical protein